MTGASPDDGRTWPAEGMRLRDVLFGAFDRHNFGDLLLAEFALAELGKPRSASLAGVVTADLTKFGGRSVESLTSVVGRLAHTALRLTHVGGEILTCDRAVARVTTQATAGVAGVSDVRDGAGSDSWWRDEPAFAAPAPYVVNCAALPAGSRTVFRAVGGVGLGTLDEAIRSYVVAALREAERVSVRDARTRAELAELGLSAALEPDPVSGIRQRFGRKILNRVAGVGSGQLAVQASAEFGDDATLDRFAAQLHEIASRFGVPVVFFRAGAAPWHDELEMLDRLRSRLIDLSPKLFASLDIWDICALIAGSAGVIGSSLHVRIVAQAFGRPAVSLLGEEECPVGQAAKVRAYVDTWYGDAPHLAAVDDLAAVFSTAMVSKPGPKRRQPR